MKLYRIPQPWDWHGIGAAFVIAATPEAAANKLRRVVQREAKKRDEFFRLQALIPGLPGTQAGIAAWAAYRKAHPEIEYDNYLAREGFEYDGIEEVTGGIGIAAGCDD